MALSPSVNSLQSPNLDAFRKSPFYVHQDDAAALQSSAAFQLIHRSLEKQQKSIFCAYHRSSASDDQKAWLLQRDITHALILPVLWIYRHASRLARTLLGNRNIFDLELVFRGDARGAFAWLQCFVVEEHDWCMTRGCPACVVSHVLQAEPTIRIVLVAGRLSQSLRQPGGDSITCPSPMLDFWSSSLRRAIEDDTFWGPIFWEAIDAQVSRLERDMQELVRQCFELETLVLSGEFDRSVFIALGGFAYGGSIGAKPQAPLIMNSAGDNGDNWMPIILLGFWNSLLADTAETEAQAYALEGALPIDERSISFLSNPLSISA